MGVPATLPSLCCFIADGAKPYCLRAASMATAQSLLATLASMLLLQQQEERRLTLGWPGLLKEDNSVSCYDVISAAVVIIFSSVVVF